MIDASLVGLGLGDELGSWLSLGLWDGSIEGLGLSLGAPDGSPVGTDDRLGNALGTPVGKRVGLSLGKTTGPDGLLGLIGSGPVNAVQSRIPRFGRYLQFPEQH